MNVRVTTTVDNDIVYNNVTGLVERTSKTTGKNWLVLKREDKDLCKIALDVVECIVYEED